MDYASTAISHIHIPPARAAISPLHLASHFLVTVAFLTLIVPVPREPGNRQAQLASDNVKCEGQTQYNSCLQLPLENVVQQTLLLTILLLVAVCAAFRRERA